MVCGQPLTLCIYLMDASAGYPKCQCDHSAKHNIPAHVKYYYYKLKYNKSTHITFNLLPKKQTTNVLK